MRALLVSAVLIAAMAGCGGVDDPPLGGPYGGQTNATDPNGGSNDNNNPTDDGGVSPTKDSGSTQKDSGGPPPPKDAGGPPPPDSGGPPPPPPTPTWSSIFNDYLSGSAEGRCYACHSEGSSAKNLYSWLQGRGYISGASSALVDPSQSCLSWYGGNMPPSGPNDAKAVTDMNAWATAGAANN